MPKINGLAPKSETKHPPIFSGCVPGNLYSSFSVFLGSGCISSGSPFQVEGPMGVFRGLVLHVQKISN